MAKDLTEALHRLTQEAQGLTTRKDKTLPASRDAVPIPARVGVGAKQVSSGGGIASPLSEADYADRTFWAPRTVDSSDGLFKLTITPIKSIKLKDTNLADCIINLVDPPE